MNPTHAENYKLLTNLVMPRPIAWVSTVDGTGVVNLAPFTFFNAVSGEPRDLFWLEDESLSESDNPPAPKVIAAEIVEDLEGALAQIREIAGDLGGTPGVRSQ